MNRTDAVSLAVRVVKQSGTTQHVLRRGDKYEVGSADRKGWKVAEMIGPGNIQNFEHIQPPAAVLICGNPTIHKTRFKELGYWHLTGRGTDLWQCVDLTGDRPAQVGTQYATKAELLANLEAYATEYGCDGANPRLSPAALSPTQTAAIEDTLATLDAAAESAYDGDDIDWLLYYMSASKLREAFGLPQVPKPGGNDDEDEDEGDEAAINAIGFSSEISDNLRRAVIGGAHDPRNDREG